MQNLLDLLHEAQANTESPFTYEEAEGVVRVEWPGDHGLTFLRAINERSCEMTCYEPGEATPSIVKVVPLRGGYRSLAFALSV